MRKELSRSRVYGFLHTRGKQILNGRDEPILMLGWGLGNWLLCEGYMWLLGDCREFDRPRRIEKTIAELTGPEYAEHFWRRFRDNYITGIDLARMAEQGYNSLRVPINSRLFLEDGDEVCFREEGFRRLDELISVCERYRLYVWIDLHGAPGGQTGSNIDDCEDDLCHLFMDEKQFERGVALWGEIARRYKDRWIVAGYDLLNEPLRPVRFEGDPPLEQYEPKLKEFYKHSIAAIRKQDERHLISLEGKYWATDLEIFDHKYDDQMVLHFHRYGCAPEVESFQPYLDAAERLDCPLWLGETGESCLTWFGAMIPLAIQLGIHVSAWTWKKMNTINSPCSIIVPEGWDSIRTWLQGGEKPEKPQIRKTLDRYLENIKCERCRFNTPLLAQIQRTPGCILQGSDFDEQLGETATCHREGTWPEGVYRRKTGMDVRENPETEIEKVGFDGPWRGNELYLHAGEWVQYTLQEMTSSCSLEIGTMADTPSRIEVRQGERLLGSFDISACGWEQILSGMRMYTEDVCTLQVKATEGIVRIRWLKTQLVPSL